MSATSIEQVLKFIDIGVNLSDPVFRGIYRGKQKHQDDFLHVLQRARAAGVRSMIITGTSLQESETALKIAKEQCLYATIGCHPTHSSEPIDFPGGEQAYFSALSNLINKNRESSRVVALGECGLDYDRTHFASPEIQRSCFRSQLILAKQYHLPLFLHCRAAHTDFTSILREEGFGVNGGQAVGGKGGVVHSFTGTVDEVTELMEMGFYIGVNGCSLKTDANIEAVRRIALDKLLLETDAPWCSMTSTHASKTHIDALPASLRSLYFPVSRKPENFLLGASVKGRNEPCAVGGIAWVVHSVHGVPIQKVVDCAWHNTINLFNLEHSVQ